MSIVFLWQKHLQNSRNQKIRQYTYVGPKIVIFFCPFFPGFTLIQALYVDSNHLLNMTATKNK